MNIFNRLFKSLYSPASIARFRFSGVGKTIVFIFVLMFIVTLPKAVMLSVSSAHSLTGFTSFIEKEVPPFTLKNGKLSVPASQVIEADKNNFTFIFDPQDTLSQNSWEKLSNAAVFRSEQMMIQSGGSKEIISYGSLGPVTLTNENILSFLHSFQGMLPVIFPVLYFIFYCILSIFLFAGVSLLACAGILLTQISQRTLSYKSLWIMASYSVTIPVIFFAVMALLNTQVPYSFILFMVVSSLVLYLSIKEVPLPKKTA